MPGGTDNDGYVYTYDSTSGAPLGSPIAVGYDPVAVAGDTTYDQLYVLNEGYGASYPPSVSVIDYENGFSAEAPIYGTSTYNLTAPKAIAVSPGGNHVVIADPGSDKLFTINPQQLTSGIVTSHVR